MSEVREFLIEGGWDYEGVPDYDVLMKVGDRYIHVDGGPGIKLRTILKNIESHCPKSVWKHERHRTTEYLQVICKRRNPIETDP